MEQIIIDNTDMRLLSIPEASKRLGIGVWAVYQQMNKGALKTIKIGGRRLIAVKTLNEFIKSMEQ
jgi:Predicted transcriptional regulator